MNYYWIGHCQEGASDKVWGVIRLAAPLQHGEEFILVWGRRGKKLQAKISANSDWYMDDVIQGKVKKGYNKIDNAKLNEVYPEFEKDLEQSAVWTLLKA